MTVGLWALVAAVVVAVAIGLTQRVREGRVRAPKAAAISNDEDTMSERFGEPFAQFPDALRQRLTGELGTDARVTLLQFSTTFCAPCRHARILLNDFAQRTDGVRHVEIDLTDHPEWSTPLRVHTTPTTLALDGSGRELFRVGGVPRRDDLADALRTHLA